MMEACGKHIILVQGSIKEAQISKAQFSPHTSLDSTHYNTLEMSFKVTPHNLQAPTSVGL